MKNKKNIPYLYFRIRKTYGKIVNTGILQKEVDSFLKKITEVKRSLKICKVKDSFRKIHITLHGTILTSKFL